jgi:hypothetical protein
MTASKMAQLIGGFSIDGVIEAKDQIVEGFSRYRQWNEITRTAKAICVLPLTDGV